MEENEKLKNNGLKEELDRLRKDLKDKLDAKVKADAALAKQNQAIAAASLAASTGGTVEEKKRYIGALQEATIRRQNNLNSLQQSVTNYKVRPCFFRLRNVLMKGIYSRPKQIRTREPSKSSRLEKAASSMYLQSV